MSSVEQFVLKGQVAATKFESSLEHFPLNIIFSVQSFFFFQNISDFMGGMIQFPLLLIQYPFGLLLGRPVAFPSRSSEFQSALNLTRYRSIHSDII